MIWLLVRNHLLHVGHFVSNTQLLFHVVRDKQDFKGRGLSGREIVKLFKDTCRRADKLV